jgi:p-hydroxybenzoate 3-monooxygenase
MADIITRVCIVGAGPAGLVIGHVLQQAGIPFVLLEGRQREALRSFTKAGLIEQRVVAALTAVGLADPIIARGARSGIAEFRLDGTPFVIDYGCRTPDGKGHFVYAQNELVADWAEELVAGGGDMRFGARVTGIRQHNYGVTLQTLLDEGDPAMVEAELVVGCDGGASIVAHETGFPTFDITHPFRWLALIAGAPPMAPRTVYGLHRRGFSAFMRRTPNSIRYYLEVPIQATHEEWPAVRVWQELEMRMGATGQRALPRGDFVERDFLDLRVRVRDPMRNGRIFLAGDAAHMVTPAGGKGMNMAILDSIELASSICELFGRSANEDRLKDYSASRLAEIWHYEEFSNWMLGLLHPTHALRGIDGVSAHEFAFGLRRARLERLVTDVHLQRWFAQAYAGT